MENKVGVYICSGCGIGDAIDVAQLAEVATSEYKVPLCKEHMSLCGPEGAEIIRQDIAREGVKKVVIAACSPRVKTDVFSYDPAQAVLERVNIREHVTWCQPPKEQDTQMLAEDYLRMGLAKAQKMEPPEPFRQEINKSILVVGGGVTGLTAAREAAGAGYDVVLVEKEAQLGGYINKVHRTLPKRPPYLEVEVPNIEALVQEVEGNPKVRVFKGVQIQSTAGAPGMFDVTIQSNGLSETVRVGAIVEAVGFKRYDARKLRHLGYGSANVVTHLEVEEMAKSGRIARPSDGNLPKSVAFIQCAGSRDPNHLPYCSTVCCMTSLKQAKYVREANAAAKVYILYKDMRTPGQYENYYKQVQQDEGIFLTKGDVVSVQEDGDKGLRIEVDNSLLGGKIEIKADMVVLATGMVPVTALGEEVVVKRPEEDGKQKKKEEEEVELPADRIIKSNVLNLTYRQGPELPALQYGFPDSHYVCFPYESRRTGIYPAGCVRQPMDALLAADDASGAALKAIQCVEMVSRGEAVHPRAGDKSYPDLYLQRCTQCKRCTEECPFGMYDEDLKGTPQPNPTRCRRCGICMGSCPERIISFKDFSVDIVGSMVKAIEVPGEDEEKPRLVCSICENDAYPAIDLAGISRLRYTPYVRFIPLRCLGDINIVWIADCLSKGIDGIMLIGCKYGDDYQCHFMKGSELADYRMGKIQETLDRLVLESDRIRVHQLDINEYGQLPGLLGDFMERLAQVGPNPYKGW